MSDEQNEIQNVFAEAEHNSELSHISVLSPSEEASEPEEVLTISDYQRIADEFKKMSQSFMQAALITDEAARKAAQLCVDLSDYLALDETQTNNNPNEGEVNDA